MKRLFLLAALLVALPVVLFSGETAYTFGGCEDDCGKCHSLSKDEAQQILVKLKAVNAKAVDVKMSQIRGLWEVSVDDKGKKGILYVGFSKKHVMSGAIFEVETAANKTKETLGGMKQPERFVDVSKIPLADSLVVGDRDAKYKVIVFTDPDCPYCGKLHAELKKIVAERKDMAFYLKLMPLKFHPDAYWKSQSIICAMKSKDSGRSLQILEDNFEKKPVPKPDCETKVVDQTMKLGGELGITGTPTLIMPNGLVVVGAADAKAIIELVLNPGKKG